MDEYGWENACERWHWIPRTCLEKIAGEGRRVLRAAAGIQQPRSLLRTTSAEEDARIVAVAMERGIEIARRETGRSYAVVVRALREAGVTAPKIDRREVALRAAETKRARRAA
jgi:hypothetical protein